MTNTHPLQPYIDHGFASGNHAADSGSYCALEACALARGLPMTDDPLTTLGVDIRPLNDAPRWRDEHHRAKHLGPVTIALWDYRDWLPERRTRFAELIAEQTIRQILPIALRAAARTHRDPEHQTALRAAADRCVSDGTADAADAARSVALAARSVALAARSAAARSAAARAADSSSYAAALAALAARSAAARAANSSSYAAARSANAARSADALELACLIWIECAERSGVTE